MPPATGSTACASLWLTAVPATTGASYKEPRKKHVASCTISCPLRVTTHRLPLQTHLTPWVLSGTAVSSVPQKCRQVILPEAFNSKYSSANPCSWHPLPENTSSTDWTQCREQPLPYCSCDQNKDSKRYISRFQFAVQQNLGTCYVLRNIASILGFPRWHGSERITFEIRQIILRDGPQMGLKGEVVAQSGWVGW